MAERKRKKAVVDAAHCVGCGCCEKVCPLAAVAVYRGIYAFVDAARCVGCGKCAAECPASVISIREELV